MTTTDPAPAAPPCFREKHPGDNAPAVLATILRHLGLRIDLITAGRALPGHRQPGRVPSLLDLRTGATKLGLAATGARGTYDQLLGVQMPVIVHLIAAQGGRFAVVHRLSAERVGLCDSAHGPMELDRAAFCAIWSGNALLCSVARQPDAAEPKRSEACADGATAS